MRSGVESVVTYIGVRGGMGRGKGEKEGEEREREKGDKERQRMRTSGGQEEEGEERERGREGGKERRNQYRYQLSVLAKFPWKPASSRPHHLGNTTI